MAVKTGKEKSEKIGEWKSAPKGQARLREARSPSRTGQGIYGGEGGTGTNTTEDHDNIMPQPSRNDWNSKEKCGKDVYLAQFKARGKFPGGVISRSLTADTGKMC